MQWGRAIGGGALRGRRHTRAVRRSDTSARLTRPVGGGALREASATNSVDLVHEDYARLRAHAQAHTQGCHPQIHTHTQTHMATILVIRTTQGCEARISEEDELLREAKRWGAAMPERAKFHDSHHENARTPLLFSGEGRVKPTWCSLA